jgi:hypothetical protein
MANEASSPAMGMCSSICSIPASKLKQPREMQRADISQHLPSATHVSQHDSGGHELVGAGSVGKSWN